MENVENQMEKCLKINQQYDYVNLEINQQSLFDDQNILGYVLKKIEEVLLLHVVQQKMYQYLNEINE
jgi:hypothetical protein